MATVQEIEIARSRAVDNLEQQMVETIARRNGSSSPTTRAKLSAILSELSQTRTELGNRAVTAQNSSPEMRDALEAIEEATTNLRRVAEHEKKLADFMRLAAAFAGASGKLSAALR